MTIRLLIGLALLASAARADSAPDLRRVFPYERAVTLARPGLVRMPVPTEVLAASRPDLSDVRVFDAGGREIPYLIDTGAPRGAVRALQQRLEATVVDARRERIERPDAPPLYRETYVLAAPAADAPAWELVFDVARPELMRRLRIDAIDADGARRPVVSDEAIFRLATPPSERLRVALPAGIAAPSRLAVTLEGEDGGYLGPRLAFQSDRSLAGEPPVAVALEPISVTTEEGRTVIEVARPAGLVPDALRLESNTPAFSRQVVVWDERPGAPAASLGAATVVRVRGATAEAAREVAVEAARGDRLRVEIRDGDSPPLGDLRLLALVRQPRLVFAVDAPGEATLLYGGGRAHAPQYDLAALRPLPDAPLDAAQAAVAVAAATATLGPQRDNPAYDRAPALAFAQRPGAELDVRAWRQRRQLTVADSPDGVTRLRLAASDLAAARPDLGDVRIVDGRGQQWPFLLQRAAAHAWQDLGVSSPVRSGHTSTVALRLPVAPLDVDQVVLEGEAAFVDRPFRLRGRAADGGESVLAEGRLTMRGEAAPRVDIAIAPQRLTALTVETDDGDEAPLAWRAARARTVVPDLFLVAPPGAYTLLLGATDARAPRYDIERARDLVFAVRGGDVSAGPLEDNPQYSLGADAGARLGTLAPRLAVWAVLLAAVLVLGVVTLRTVRR